MSEHDDQHWLDALAGKPPDGEAERSTLKEAAVVRHAMLVSQQQRRAPQLDVESGLRRLLARMRAEKLLDESGRRRGRWAFPAIAAAACLVLALGIAMRQQQGEKSFKPPDVPVMRGGPGASQVIEIPEVRDLAAEMATAMTNAGLTPTVTEFGGAIRLEADWPSSPGAKQVDFLRDYGLARPDGPRLRIEVRQPQQ